MIVRLMGGLGNQLFQYAFGASVAEARGESVWFSKHLGADRPFMLDAFLIDVPLTNYETEPVFNEPGFAFCPDVYNAPRGATFIGYWQTERYFGNGLRNKLLLRNPISKKSRDVAQQIWKADDQSAFIHVRRGDYLSAGTNAFHGMPDRLYYSHAVERIRKATPDAKFFVFSDDPAWCRTEFPNDFTVIDHNANAPHEDLWLMAACRHAILANSSFSWWGAWFGDARVGRTVVAPKRWFNADLNTRDLLPGRWETI